MSKTFSDEAENCKVNCKPTSTAMFDNADSQIDIEQHYPDQETAQQAFDFLVNKVKQIENEPCQITHQLISQEDGVTLNATFNFSCQAEAVLFQLALR